jgi:glycosyltransferase involved in cell wall biosynthesis
MPIDAGQRRRLHCLWLTYADPEPRHSGEFIYSGGLIDAVAQAGVEVEVLALGRSDAPRRNGHRDPSVVWWLDNHGPLSRLGSVASALPHIVYRCRTAEMQRMLHDLLRRGGWDGIVFDGLSSGWALAPVLEYYAGSRNRPRLVYVSHNHEESTRELIAKSQVPFLKRQAMRLDAQKATRLERELVETVDTVTAITPDDMQLYRARWPDKPMDVLTPGYRGRSVASRRITASMPRRAVIVGSFEWIAKRMNLEEFITVADSLFAARGAELQVIGSAKKSFLARLRKRTVATEFTGTVPDVTEYLDAARIAIVPERTGGGFKLKVLEYVFNRLPIFGLAGSVAGVPLRNGDEIMLFPDHASLARGVLNAMDDIDLLNRIQQRAFVACSGRFDWASRGRQLTAAIAG